MQVLTHTFSLDELELNDDGIPLWVAYIDDYYSRVKSNEKRFNFSKLSGFKNLKRDLNEKSFKTIEGKVVNIDYDKLVKDVDSVIKTENVDDDIALLKTIKNVGPELAWTLVKLFGDLQGVLDANDEDLLNVYGINKRIINSIRKYTRN